MSLQKCGSHWVCRALRPFPSVCLTDTGCVSLHKLPDASRVGRVLRRQVDAERNDLQRRHTRCVRLTRTQRDHRTAQILSRFNQSRTTCRNVDNMSTRCVCSPGSRGGRQLGSTAAPDQIRKRVQSLEARSVPLNSSRQAQKPTKNHFHHNAHNLTKSKIVISTLKARFPCPESAWGPTHVLHTCTRDLCPVCSDVQKHQGSPPVVRRIAQPEPGEPRAASRAVLSRRQGDRVRAPAEATSHQR